MKVQYKFACGLWEEHEPSSLTFDCKRLRPLIDPKLQPDHPGNNIATFDLKSFIRPAGSCSRSSTDDKKDSMEMQGVGGGTRWNPTQEQISILEMLYRGGMRTPNAQQIEEISGQLCKYGKIEGKNVFYWFQNHKARERQKHKRSNSNNILCRNQTTPTVTSTMLPLPAHDSRVYSSNENEEDSIFKRKCRSWTFNCLEEDKKHRREEEEEDRTTLLLFPLHPESR